MPSFFVCGYINDRNSFDSIPNVKKSWFWEYNIGALAASNAQKIRNNKPLTKQ